MYLPEQVTKIEQVSLSAIHSLPVQAKNTSRKLEAMISQAAKENPDKIPPILVGRVNSEYYVLNDFETIQGCRKAGMDRIGAFVIGYDTIDDLLSAHVQKNYHPQTVDPLRLVALVAYMTGDKGDVDDVCKRLWLDKYPKLYGTVRADMTDEARDILLEMTNEISAKVYSVVTPLYYVNLLAKITRQEQAQAAMQMKLFTLEKTISDDKFSWLSFDAITKLLREFSRAEKHVPVETRIRDELGETGDLNKKSKPKKKDIPASTVKKASQYISSDPNLIFVPIEGDHPDLLLNKKTGRVAVAEEKNRTYAITDDLGQTTQTLPNHIPKYLGIEDESSIFLSKYLTIDRAQKALASAKAKKLDCRLVIMSASRIPRG